MQICPKKKSNVFHVIVCFSLQVNFPETETRTYPDWVFGIIVLLSVAPVVSIPIVALYRWLPRMFHKERNLNAHINDAYDMTIE